MREPFRRRISWTLLTILALFAAPGLAQDEPTGEPAAPADDPATPPPHRVFAASRFDLNEILGRPYTPEVPFGSTGDRLWATSPQGWGFDEGVHWLYRTDFPALDLQLRDESGHLLPARATAYPSHVHMEGVTRSVLPSASFTFRTDRASAPLSKPFDPAKRWTCWSSGNREDWYAIDFGGERTLTGLKVHFYDDTGTGGVRPPEAFAVQAWLDGEWKAVEPSGFQPKAPAPGENTVTFAAPATASRFRLVFTHAGEDFYTGLYGLEPILEGPEPPVTLQVEGDKFIAPDDILVAVLRVKNPGTEPAFIQVAPVLGWTGQQEFRWLSNRLPGSDDEAGVWALEGAWFTQYHEQDVRQFFRFTVASDPPVPQVIHENLRTTLADSSGPADNLTFLRDAVPLVYKLEPGETKVFKAALEFRQIDEPARIDRVLSAATTVPRVRRRTQEASRFGSIEIEKQDTRDVVADQAAASRAWFDDNLAFFDSSDPLLTKMYYHRAYVLRKNMMDPKLGALKHPTQAEGRWRSGWYPHVISYGGAHQLREARWLRDPSYWQGHLATWAENRKADGVYPARVLPSGPTDWQYTDWITSTAWDGHLVHPSAEFLAPLADALAANVRGIQQAYDPDGDGLLLVDSHWWTGMEYQPSFFFFSDFQTRPDFHEPAEPVALERVDFTAYNYGNAVAVAKLYRALGQPEKAGEFDDLAAKIAAAVREKMWKPEGEFFYSLRAQDDAVADVKEVIGVYPFYFGMLPAGEGYEAAWGSILDPEQFWTPWPVASASKQTPAYSQSGWPQADGRAATCMWNGPTWPHANSIVLSAMARTLRADRELAEDKTSPLTPEAFYELFTSFTKAQYRDQDPENPWTGEFYDGETGAWKTAERDYNHSTYLDILIPDVLGLVPRDDEILEVDPLIPPSALSRFLLDGQHYRGHDITIVWDAPDDGEDAYDDGREGLDVYVDGKLAASSPTLGRLLIDLKTGKPAG